MPSTASTADEEIHGLPTLEQNIYVDARSLHLMQQNAEVSFAGETHVAAQVVRLAAELRFRENEDSARNIVLAEMQELRQVADSPHEGRIVALTNHFSTFADGMRTELKSTKAELRSTQESFERRNSENIMQERHSESLIDRLVERIDRKDEEMLAIREIFDPNRAEIISFLKEKISDELAEYQAEHRRILMLEEEEFDSLIQDLSEQNAELQRRLGEIDRSSAGVPVPHHEDSFP